MMRSKIVVLAFILALAAVVMVRTAWMCDDAYITLRTVDNFVNGYGLTWNTGERVQAYTHPLWLFVLTPFYAITRDAFFMPMIVSILISLVAIGMLALKQLSKTTFAFLVSAAVLLLSKAFIEYATSGLENPLSYLLILAFLAVLFAQMEACSKLLPATLLAALIGLNRLDLLLIALPPLVYLFFDFARRNERWLSRAGKTALIGFSPLIAWFVFSIFYYGFPFPNTFYAKLNTGVPLEGLAAQGIHYFVATALHDPLTMLFLAIGVVAGFASLKAERVAVAFGLLLYMAYIVRIGGDFMVGRLFALPLVAAVALLSAMKMPVWARGILLAVALALGLAFPDATVFSDERIYLNADGSRRSGGELIDERGVCNERVHWYTSNGLLIHLLDPEKTENSLLQALRERRIEPPRSDGKIRADQIVIAGRRGFLLGPNRHVVDIHALSDPLLARVPVQSLGWRIGHFRRKIPRGYLESIAEGNNRIVNPYLAEFYGKLKIITQGDLFSPERFAAIWGMNTGAYDHLVEQYRFNADLAEVSHDVHPRAGVHSPLTRIIESEGLLIDLNGLFHQRKLRVGLDRNDRYRLEFYKHERLLGSVRLGPAFAQGDGIIHYDCSVPPRIAGRGYRRIKIVPEQGDGRYYMGSIEFPER